MNGAASESRADRFLLDVMLGTLTTYLRMCGELVPADAADAPEHVPEDVEPYRCRDCGQWFWRGPHWDDVAGTLAAL